jgi:hypothetical protein
MAGLFHVLKAEIKKTSELDSESHYANEFFTLWHNEPHLYFHLLKNNYKNTTSIVLIVWELNSLKFGSVRMLLSPMFVVSEDR